MTPRALRPYQTEAANEVESAWREGLNRVSVVLPTGTGKMVPHSTPVPTPSGMRNHGDLCVGDEVFHPSGRPVVVTHIHPQGVVDVWRITFSDKSSVLAGKEHLWKVRRRKRKPRLMTTGELSTAKLMDFAGKGEYMWQIPMTEPVLYPDADLPIDPFAIGALIAKGRSIDNSSLVTVPTSSVVGIHEKTVLTYPEAIVRKMGLNVYSDAKFIPQQYLTASVDQRVALLQGLIDGSSREDEKPSLTYRTTSPQISHDVQRLVWSLGGTAAVDDSSGEDYVIHICLPPSIAPWHLSLKDDYPDSSSVFTPQRYVVSVKYEGKEDCQCITVDNPDGLYLVGEEHIVTHNSTVIAEVATRARRENKKVLLLAHRAELLDQMAEAVHAVDPSGQDVGIVAADRDDNSPDIVAASFQTLARSPKRLAALGRRDVILADECFPAGTPLNDGRNIDALRVGDTVDSWDENEGRIVRRRVTKTFKSVPLNIVRVQLSNEDVIHCTPGHPFLTAEGAWTPAIDLAGKCIIHQGPMGGCTLHVSEVTILYPGDDGTFDGACPDGHVYNIEVDETHTYLIDRGYVVHNCHHISAPTYLKVLEDLKAMEDASGVTSCGFTATMYRDDGKALGEVWSDVVFERDIVWAIQNGFLIPPKGKTVAIPALNKLSAIKTLAGDYKQNELAEVMGASVDSTVDAILRHCPTAAMIVFAVSVEHARTLAEKLSANGIPSRDVTGSHKRDYREEAYGDFREGRLNCLVTVQVLTEGADFPRCDTVVMARPTRSRVLFTQMLGRSVRPYTDPVTGLVKTDATVLDLTGVVRDIKLASLTDLFPEAKRQYFDDNGTDRSDDDAFVDELLGRAPPGKERKGRIDLEDVDLIDSSMKAHKALWLRTGPVNQYGDDIAFMPLKNGGEYIFIYPPINRVGPEMVVLGRISKNGGTSFVTGSDGVPLRGSLTQAMDAAENLAGPSNYIGVKAGWRNPSVPPSDAQINLGNNLGIHGSAEMSRGELSDAISVHFARRVFSGIVQRYPYTTVNTPVIPAQK